MDSYSQSTRAVRIHSALVQDSLHFLNLVGHEAISELFQFEIEVRRPSETPLDYDDLLGTEIVLEIGMDGSPARHLAGLVAELEELGRDATGYTYRLRLVPRFWTYSLGRRSRLFQQLTVPEILRKVLAGLETRFELAGEYPAHNLCVQYDESDFAFASRLMEEEGIYYYFEHTENGDRLVLADTSPSAPLLPKSHDVVYGQSTSGSRVDGRIHQWSKVQSITVGKTVLRDYCFERSKAPIDGEAAVSSEVAIGKVTHHLTAGGALTRNDHHFPAGFVHRFDSVGPTGNDQSASLAALEADAKRMARLRMEQRMAAAVQIRGESNCDHLLPGYQFCLKEHYSADGNYLITRVEHRLRSPDVRSGSVESWHYHNSFVALPIALAYRPPMVTPRATVRGSQTAIVMGLGEDPIHTDKYGRVKVRFHWDTQAGVQEDSSAWIRVGQNWAGNGWGMVNIPRANQEVVVDFLDGDPDCPIIVGSVYNQENMPPFALPENKTFAGIKTDSHLSSDPASFNGLAFNDKDGAEEVHLRAQKDMVTVVKNNHLTTVNGQHFEHTGGVRFTSVGGFPVRHGSGSGGGDGFVHTISEVVGWGWDMLKEGLGQSFATNIGVEARKGVGKCSTSVYGAATATIVDPVAWSDEFAIPVHSNLTYVSGTVYGGGNYSLVYGTYVDRSFGARLRAQRGPLFEYAGSMKKEDFPTRKISAVQPMPTMVALITEEALKKANKNNVDALVSLNTSALLIEAGLSAVGNYLERAMIRTQESKLKLNDGSAQEQETLRAMPTVFSDNSDTAVGLIKAKNADNAALDLVFQSEASEQRAAHRILVDGPYSVKSSGMLELTTYEKEQAGKARLNLSDDTAVLAAQKLVSVLGQSSLIEVGAGINAYGGAEGNVQIGAGQTQGNLDAFAKAVFTKNELTLTASSNGIGPAKIALAEKSVILRIGGDNECVVSMDGKSITLGCGTNTITINSQGIQIKGTLIKLDSQSGIQHTTPLEQVKN